MASPERYLEWTLTDRNGFYYRLNDVDLTHPRFDGLRGVYIIFCEKESSRDYIYVGKGIIEDRLYKHRRNKRIRRHGLNNRILYVTWAIVPLKRGRTKIENYLHDQLEPLESKRPSKRPTADKMLSVNLPWDQ